MRVRRVAIEFGKYAGNSGTAGVLLSTLFTDGLGFTAWIRFTCGAILVLLVSDNNATDALKSVSLINICS